MPQFPADGQPGLVIDLTLLRGKALSVRSTVDWGLPAGQFCVAVLSIGVAQPVHSGEPGTQGIALVDPQLMYVVAVARDQRRETGQAPRPSEDNPLPLGPYRDDPLLAALGPAGL